MRDITVVDIWNRLQSNPNYKFRGLRKYYCKQCGDLNEGRLQCTACHQKMSYDW